MLPALLATKLHRPAVPLKRVPRPALLQRLNAGLAAGRRITLVSAPAGFGKTTCVAEWVSRLEVPVTWLALEPADDEPERFFAYFIAALQGVEANLGRELESLLRGGQLPPAESLGTALLNDLLKLTGRVLLVLDDFHVIQNSFSLQVLARLVANLPAQLHLVLLTREDPSLPLARWRANGQLTEIRVDDLRFTPPEVDCYLNEVLALGLSQTDTAVLAARTEGWVVGLHLAGLSIRDRPDSSGFIAGLSGSHRFILSYLTEEVLSRQAGAVQEFLLQTSILERLSGDLCNAVTGRTDSQAMLERLLNANLFLIPLDDEQRWYRYHPLFADLLRARLNTLRREKVAELHRQASRWCAQAGMVSEAIQHALAAADYAAAVQLIESHAVEMLLQGYALAVEKWIQTIPPEWSAQSPRANLALTWMYLMRGAFAQALPGVERLQRMPSIQALQPGAGGDTALQAEWLALQATLLNAQAKPAESLALASQALALVPEKEGYVQSLIYMGLAGAYQQLDDYPRAVDAFQKLIRHGRAAGNFVSETLGVAGLLQTTLNHGQYHFACEVASQGIERIECLGVLVPVAAALYGALGEVYYQWHQLERAHPYYQRAVQISTLSGYSDAEIGYQVILSRLRQVAGDLEAAHREVQRAVDRMQVTAPVWTREMVVAQQVRVYLAQARLAAAEAVLQGQGFGSPGEFSVPALPPEQAVTLAGGHLYNSALRILLQRAHLKHELAGLSSGLALADRLIAGALQRRYPLMALETLLLRAQMHVGLGQVEAGRADVTKALEVAEPEGFISVFVEEGPPVAALLAELGESNRLEPGVAAYLNKILAAFPGSQPAALLSDALPGQPSQAQIEPLTDRELEVLRLMGQGLKYEEIAQKLFISLNTVRSHAKAIYGKFNVNNRTKAIELASRLQLL